MRFYREKLPGVPLAISPELWYSFFGATSNGRRFPHPSGVIFFAPDSKEKGVSHMITWSELFQFCAIIIALISLVVQIIDKKKK